MEGTTLNMILVFSFLFVSVALGVKWIGEMILQIVLARQGLQMQREDMDRLFEALEDEDEE
jgi:nicotinamide riboside transporter PnuC